MIIVFGRVEEKNDNGLNGGLNLEVSLPIHPLLQHFPLRTSLLLLLEATMCSECFDELDARKSHQVALSFFFFASFIYFLYYRLLD